MRDFLQCRTIGVCICQSRLLGFHVVRSTRPVTMVFTHFIQPKEFSKPRDDRHKTRYPDYPHPDLILSKTQQYFFRNNSLKHLRIEQIVRYYSTVGWMRRGEQTEENTMEHDDEDVQCQAHHRHHDEFSERTRPGQKFLSRAADCDVYQRRKQARLGVCITPFLEPLGKKREDYYEQRLLLGLPWYLDESPKIVDGELQWTFKWNSPVPGFVPRALEIGSKCSPCFEEEAKTTEDDICSIPGIICECCLGNLGDKCENCLHATSFHKCRRTPGKILWSKGTIFGGMLDYQRAAGFDVNCPM